MKTITFYSYKGGVGRSLALSNIANRLSELGQKVCMVDFDLEAPGLNFKFKRHKQSKNIELGLVDYIYDFSHNNILHKSIKDYVIDLNPGKNSFKDISLIPAGDVNNVEYWKKLSKIDWYNLFYEKGSKGVKFFLDLKQKIKEELQPDFLLIDSRTGITDIAGITLKLLADQAIILSVNNEENLFGSKKIISSLLNVNNNLNKKEIEINFILTRCPFSFDEKEKELVILEKLRKDFHDAFPKNIIDISIIHADKRLEQEESYLSAINYDFLPGSVSNDYFELLEKIVKGKLNLNDQIIIKKRAETHFLKFSEEKKIELKLKHINKAISLDSKNSIYLINRSIICIKLENYKAALEDLNEAENYNFNEPFIDYLKAFIDFKKNNFQEALKRIENIEDVKELNEGELMLKGNILNELGRYEDAIECFNVAINSNPLKHEAFNSRANSYRKLGKFTNALNDIEQAIKLENGKGFKGQEAVYLGTLAEVYFSMDRMNEFYFNLRLAFSKGLKPENMFTSKDIYLKIKNDQEFLEILKDYEISIYEIINN